MDKYERRRLRLTELRDTKCGGNGAELARKIGRDPSYVTRMLYPEGKAGKKRIADDMIELIEAAFLLPRGWLDQNAALFDRESNTGPGPDLRGSVPLISWVKAGAWCASSDIFSPGDADVFYPTTAKVGPNAYALLVDGDSMEPKFPHGCVIIVDPSREARNGSFVVVREANSAEATFKQLQIDGARKYLKPLNPRYPLMELREETLVCGVVVKMEMDV